jgi:hypothetical protein
MQLSVQARELVLVAPDEVVNRVIVICVRMPPDLIVQVPLVCVVLGALCRAKGVVLITSEQVEDLDFERLRLL